MGTDRKFNTICQTRPKKVGARRRGRDKAQRRRLVSLGVSEKDIRTFTSARVRDFLKAPKRIPAKLAEFGLTR